MHQNPFWKTVSISNLIFGGQKKKIFLGILIFLMSTLPFYPSSFGMVLFEIISREVPYFGMNEEDVRREIINFKKPIFPNDSLNSNLIFRRAIEKCWQKHGHKKNIYFISI